MARKSKHHAGSDRDARRLLKRYDCPMPFHAVRAFLLGNIACPKLDTRPLQALEELWGGELPEFESLDDLNELIGALVNGLWNRLARHQDRKHPFRLTGVQLPANKEEIRQFAKTRVEELDAFVDGLFDNEERLDLPESAHEALARLSEVGSFFAGFAQFADDHETVEDIKKSVRNLQQLSIIAAKEINTVVLGCTKARRDALKTIQVTPPAAD